MTAGVSESDANGGPGETPSEGSDQPEEKESGFDGSWSGTTSEGGEITFTVADGVITRVFLESQYGGAECRVVSGESQRSPDAPVVGGEFSFGGSGEGHLVEGSFDSDTTASGRAHFVPDEALQPQCETIVATWEARKS